MGSSMPFVAAVLYQLSISGRNSTYMRLRACVVTCTNHWMLGGLVWHLATRMSRRLSVNELSIRRVGSGCCGIQIGATVSSPVARIGVARDPTRWTGTAFSSIDFM